MKNSLMVLGKQNIGGYEFIGIEGGFGKGKKCMLVRDIAKIHGREVKHVNELINNNIQRFSVNDLVDLLGVGFDDTEIKSFGYSQQAINSYRGLKAKGRVSGIYILSERGYAKLLKIMDDDLAWEIYDKFVDEYFTMREVIKEDKNQIKKLSERTPMESLKNNSIVLNDLFKELELNIPKELIASTAIITTQRETGYDFAEVKLLLNKQDEDSYNTKSYICKKVGIKSNKVNLALEVLGLQVEGNTTMQPWILTELGKEYAVERSFTKNGYQGYEIKLKANAEEYIKNNLHKLPEDWIK